MGIKRKGGNKLGKGTVIEEDEEGSMHPLPDIDDSGKNDNMSEENVSQSGEKAREHMKQLQRLEEKDPEFYQFLKDYDKELLEFNDEDADEDAETDLDDLKPQIPSEKEQKPSVKVITTPIVDSWCNAIRESGNLGAVRSLMRAFRTACHYGDAGEDDSSTKFSIMSSSVFNKIMVFVLSEMDLILRELLKFPTSGGKKETVVNLMTAKEWKNHGYLMKSYLGNALHVLNQMTDNQMISFTLRRLRYSAIFLAAFPNLLRKYIKVALHFWGTGGGALPVVSFLFLRDLCIRISSDCLETCLKGIYKAYTLNCQYVNASELQHIQFLGNCVVELYGVDLPCAYQHAFVFIRQLGMILRDALTVKTKEAFRKVYNRKFMNCLELWTGVICAYGSEADFRPLAYPLTQIISGVPRLVPTARYFPVRLRCTRMLNRIGAATGTYIPVSLLLLDMLEMKELTRPPIGGVGEAVDLRTTLKVSKSRLNTRAFQEACVFSVVEQLAEHLAQWSYSVAFFELAFIPLTRLKSFCKSTKVQRFRRELKELIRQVEASSEFINSKRMNIAFSPSDPAVASFLQAEKDSRASPLSKYVDNIRARAQQRSDSIIKSSVLVGEKSSVFDSKISEIAEDPVDREEGTAVFNSPWLPGSDSNAGAKKAKSLKKMYQEGGIDEDVVEELVLSSEEDEADEDEPVKGSSEEELGEKRKPMKQENRKRKPSSALLKRRKPRAKKPKARKTVN
ncbi:noc2p family [Tasmannia lanceolata]|uniref:noc2p family n=1 Tax=Tasmannia lanceolata TaxID=3420 RepID=UPI0040646969